MNCQQICKISCKKLNRSENILKSVGGLIFLTVCIVSNGAMHNAGIVALLEKEQNRKQYKRRFTIISITSDDLTRLD